MSTHLPFSQSDFLSLGVEVEVQVVDLQSGALVPAGPALLKALPQCGHYRPEYYRSNLEFVTGVCSGLREVEVDLRRLGAGLSRLAKSHNLGLIGSGTHPFADRAGRDDIWPDRRYIDMYERDQWVARSSNILGLHVHVGMRDSAQCIELMNGFAPYLGHLLALSANSPFLRGEDTGLASSRSLFYESQPIAGPTPTLHSYADFEQAVHSLKASKSIASLKDLHWDMRPSPNFGTLEIRICDGQNRLEDTMALVALMQWIFAWLDERRQDGERFSPVPDWRLRENKWRAMRFGLAADLLTDDQGSAAPARDDLLDLLARLEPTIQRLQGESYLKRVKHLIADPGYAQQRRAMIAQGSDLSHLVQHLSQDWLNSHSLVPLKRRNKRPVMPRSLGGRVTDNLRPLQGW